MAKTICSIKMTHFGVKKVIFSISEASPQSLVHCIMLDTKIAAMNPFFQIFGPKHFHFQHFGSKTEHFQHFLCVRTDTAMTIYSITSIFGIMVETKIALIWIVKKIKMADFWPAN